MKDKPKVKQDGLRRRLLSVMGLTTLTGALLGCIVSVTYWLAIRVVLDLPMDFFGEGLGWAMLFVGLHSAFWGGIGFGLGLLYATYRLWMNLE
jgi:hypothetical protein